MTEVHSRWDLRYWSLERLRDTMFKTNRFFRKQIQQELSWRQHDEWKRKEGL